MKQPDIFKPAFPDKLRIDGNGLRENSGFMVAECYSGASDAFDGSSLAGEIARRYNAAPDLLAILAEVLPHVIISDAPEAYAKAYAKIREYNT